MSRCLLVPAIASESTNPSEPVQVGYVTVLHQFFEAVSRCGEFAKPGKSYPGDGET
jgi:hypothetical protein